MPRRLESSDRNCIFFLKYQIHIRLSFIRFFKFTLNNIVPEEEKSDRQRWNTNSLSYETNNADAQADATYEDKKSIVRELAAKKAIIRAFLERNPK